MKTITALLVALFVFAAGSNIPSADAQGTYAYIVIVNKSNTAKTLPRTFVADAYLKKVTRWPNGRDIYPVDMPTKSPVRKQFSSSVLKRTPAAVRNYWTGVIFGGKDTPPPELKSDDAVIAWVAKRPGAIGYVSVYAESDLVKQVTVK